MGYIIEHLFDSPMFYKQLEIDESLERIKRERSKNRLTFKRGGEVMVLTLDARNGKRSFESAMGFGSPNIVFDESSLVEDPLYSSVKRMLGGYKDNFLFEIGNPFFRNHFYRTWQNDNYHKIFADYNTAIEEGRFTKEFIEEMRAEAYFDVYYECKFPDEDLIDSAGYRQLIKLNDLSYEEQKPVLTNKAKLGADIAGGGDYNVYVIREGNVAYVAQYNKSNDTMTNVTEIERYGAETPIQGHNMSIDDIGIGRGVVDRLKEKKMKVNGVSVGEKARDKKFSNLKAELSWEMKKWIEAGGKLVPCTINGRNVWEELTWVKYKVNTDKLIKIEPKQDLKKRSGKSPDFAEALMLTFYERPFVGIL